MVTDSAGDEVVVEERAVALGDNVDVTVFDVGSVREEIDRQTWRTMPKGSRRELVTNHARVVDEQTTHNVTCIGWHEYLPTLLNFKHDYEQIADPASEVAFGDDAASGFAIGDRSLNNRVGAIELTDPADQGDTWSCAEYLSSLELNGETLREGGIISASGALWNHFELPQYIQKDSNTALLIEIRVPFGDQSEA